MKKFTGYSPAVAVIGDHIVSNENRNGNAHFHQQDTLERIFSRFEENGIHVDSMRMDCGSCSEEIVDTVKAHCKYFYIRANRYSAFMTTCSFSEDGGDQRNRIRTELHSR